MTDKVSTLKIATEAGVFEFRVPGHVKAIQVNGEVVDATPKMLHALSNKNNPFLAQRLPKALNRHFEEEVARRRAAYDTASNNDSGVLNDYYVSIMDEIDFGPKVKYAEDNPIGENEL